MQHLSDEQLVVLVLQGQSEAFAILVERYQKQIFALAYRLGGDYDEARDMAQEAFVRIYQELSRLFREREFTGRLSIWLPISWRRPERPVSLL